MQEVTCLYCGKQAPGDVTVCPHCGALSHFQRRGWRFGARRRSTWLFWMLVVACLAVALWLPR